MNSIGNDIVDLHFIDKERTQSTPFYSKFLSEAEQQLYATHFKQIPFWQYVWLLWSCKEAVYKFGKRHQPGLMFSPAKIITEPRLSEPEFSEVENLQNGSLQLKFCTSLNPVNSGSEIICNSIITQDHIHTIAYSDPDLNNIVSDVKRIDETDYEHQSAAVRQLISAKLADVYLNSAITFGKAPAGYPTILNHGADTGIVTSFAHHGNYVAYAFNST